MWFLKNIDRLNTERLAIDELISEVDWLVDVTWGFNNSQLSLTAQIFVGAHSYDVQMVYPSMFPFTPPSVRPFGSDQHWSGHQYGPGGDLCLEWGPDNWQESITGADLLRSTYKLLFIDRPYETGSQLVSEAPSRHLLTLGQELRSKSLRFLVHSDTKNYIAKLRKKSYWLVNFTINITRKSPIVFIGSLSTSKKYTWQNPFFPKELDRSTFQLKGIHYRTSLPIAEIKSYDTPGLIERLKQEGLDLEPIKNPDIKYVLLSDSERYLHLFDCNYSKEKWFRYETIELTETDFTTRVGTAIEKYREARIGIVGLGSAGSKIAVSLARSGIRNFFLYDHDLLFPENLSRHVLSWEDIGQHKVDGISHLLSLIDPEIKVTSRKLMLTGQEASSGVSNALSQLADFEIIIDATAKSEVFNLLSSVSYQSNTPYVWVEIYEGGIGGFVGRFRPGLDPNPIAMRAALDDFSSKQVTPELISKGNYSASDQEGDIIIATDADVSIISGYATNMVLDILSENEPSLFPHSMYLIGLRKGWIFSEPFYTQPIDPVDIQSEMKSESLDNKERNENIEFLQRLIDDLKS